MSDITLQSSDDNSYVVDRLTNYLSTAEGSLLPPVQRGEFRVPFASGFQIIQTVNTLTSSTFTLTWLDIADDATLKVDHYNIYYTLNGTNTSQPVGPFTAYRSPAQITVPVQSQVAVTFYLQTVLANGMTSDLLSSPTTAGFGDITHLTPGNFDLDSIQISDLVVSNNSPTAGSISWTACTVYYQGSSYTISAGTTSNKFISWTVGATSFTSAATFTPGPTVFLILTNTTGTYDLAWNKVAAGGIQESNLAFSLLYGLTYKTPAQSTVSVNALSFPPPVVTSTVLTANSSNAPNGGGLLTVGLYGGAGGQFDMYLDITVDGGSTNSIQIYSTGASGYLPTAVGIASLTSGGGQTSTSFINFYFGITFRTSLTVAFRSLNSNATSSAWTGVVGWATKNS